MSPARLLKLNQAPEWGLFYCRIKPSMSKPSKRKQPPPDIRSRPLRSRREPKEGQHGFGSGHVFEQRKRIFAERDNPNVAERDGKKSWSASIHLSGSSTGPSGGCTVTAAWWAAWCRMRSGPVCGGCSSPEDFRKWSTWPGRGMPRSIGPRHHDATKFFNKIKDDFRRPCIQNARRAHPDESGNPNGRTNEWWAAKAARMAA